MANWLQKQIKRKLANYRQPLNKVDIGLPYKLLVKKKVAVIGGGIAGISAASNLAERGFEVTLFEKASFLGGKCGSWMFESNGEMLRTEHGFHAFFRQYLNLRDYMQKIGAAKHLIPIEDYIIYFKNGDKQGFAGIDNTPGLNILDLRKRGVFNLLTFINPFSIPFLNLLAYKRERTFKQFDNVSFEAFAKKTMMPKNMQIVFNSFARAFFAEPDKMSMAELIKGFHFYFLSNDDGLMYDVLEDDFQKTFIDYCELFLDQNGAKIFKSTAVECIEKNTSGFKVNNQMYDYCVLCTDVKHTPPIIRNSPDLADYKRFNTEVQSLQPSDRYAVYRIWTDTFEMGKHPFFVFTDRIECLDSVTFYHQMEKESASWSKANSGGIFELHSYALPAHLKDDEVIKSRLIDEFCHFFPEMNKMKIKHSFFQHRQDFPAFHTGLYAQRPSVITEVPGLFLAGDWVKMDNTTMLMEAAYTSGAMAANYICSENGLQENPLISVPVKGLLA